MKKRLMVVVMVMGMVALLAGIAQADWVTCSISQVGSTGTGYLIKASDTNMVAPGPLFTNVTFVIDPYSGKGKEMLATALTAFANSTYVQIYVVAPYTDYTVAWGVLAAK